MTDFELEFVSDQAHERLMVEVLFRKQRVCQVSREGGEEMKIEILDDHYILDEDVTLKFPLADFQRALREAEKALLECHNEGT